MTNEVRALLDKINAIDNLSKQKNSHSADTCVKNFLSHLQWLEDRHCKKTWPDEYLVSNCYNRFRWFATDAEASAYCRVNLYIATRQFEKLSKEMINAKGVITHQKLKQYKAIIRDYIFDLKPIAEHLERRKKKEYNFFTGQKNYGLMSWQIFLASRQLAAMSLDKSIQLDHKASHIAATFMLRQALEAKFERVIHVTLHDKSGQNPKIRHDFNYNFIKDNQNFFAFTAVDFLLLRKIYTWCNTIVHKAIQPLVWQLTYALDISKGLFSDGPLNDNGGWSINGGVRITDTDQMQKSYIEHFCKTYEHGLWCTEQQTPEAVCNYSQV